MMEIFVIAAFMVVTGALVGLVSSFFGVGACFIMVPMMIYYFETFTGVPPTLAPLIAFGTNMAIVVPTAFSGVLRHNRELKMKKLSFPTKHYLSFGVPVGVGGFLGSLAAFTFFTTYPAYAGIMLKTIFGLLCLFGAYRFMMTKPVKVDSLRKPSILKYAGSGLFSGIGAHFIGVGGGIIYMLVLNTFLSVPIHLTAPLSLATMVIGSTIGALSFGAFGHIDQMQNPSAYPPLSFGWFNLTAFLGVGVTSVIFAQVGPRLAHRTSPKRFKMLLGILYVFIGIRLILRGIYQLQGLLPPIP